MECDAVPVAAVMTAGDACDAEVTVGFNEQRTNGSCDYSYTLVRTWTATDDCGNDVQCVQTITVSDTTDPVLTCAADARVACGTTIVFTEPGVSDNCDASPEVVIASTDVVPGPGAGEITHTRTWTATDACGNSAQCSQVITETGCSGCSIGGPAALCPSATGRYCGPDGMDYEWSIMGDGTIVPPVTTQCVDVVAGAGCNTGFMLVLSLNGGVAGTCTTSVVVRDITAPVITCPANVTVECPGSTEPASTGTATATDLCDATPAITHSDVVTPGSCPQEYSIERTWFATDDCSNSSDCVQTITVVDTTDPYFTSACPANDAVECDAVPVAAVMTAGDACDADVTVGFNEQRTNGSCDYSYTLVRTWTATDDCGNDVQCVQTITVSDTTEPVLTCAADERVACGTTIVFTEPAVSDNCDASPEVVIASTDVVPGPGAGEITHTRTWTATDACGNFGAVLSGDNRDGLLGLFDQRSGGAVSERDGSTTAVRTGWTTSGR